MTWAFFHYVLAEFALPSGIGILLLTASVITRRKILGIAALILLTAFSMRVVGWPLAHSLEIRTRPIAVEDCPFADVVFPLGGILAPQKNPDGPVEFGLGGPRFERALELFSAGRARAILLSGARTPPGSTSEGERLRREAIRRGVPADAITVTGEAPNTEAEALAYRELARRRNWKSLLLVTSAFHMWRAAHLFRRIGVDVVPVPVGFTPKPQFFPPTVDAWMPEPDNLVDAERCIKEYEGMIFYTVVRR
jgi:uncharacterized SAM-binding protein YcdF (DUF218 family)